MSPGRRSSPLIEPREYTDKDRRVFGLVLGGLLLGLAALQARRGRPIWPVLAGAGALCALAGAFLPGLLAPVLSAWMRVATVIAAVNTYVLMGILYVFVFTPLGQFKRLRGEDPLDEGEKGDDKSYWRPHEKRAGTDGYKRLF